MRRAVVRTGYCAGLGISKTPVREAILELKRQGLVDVQPQRGTFVFEMSADQVVQLAEVRSILELAALGLAMDGDPRALGPTLVRDCLSNGTCVG